jgi:hypothetical protein
MSTLHILHIPHLNGAGIIGAFSDRVYAEKFANLHGLVDHAVTEVPARFIGEDGRQRPGVALRLSDDGYYTPLAVVPSEDVVSGRYTPTLPIDPWIDAIDAEMTLFDCYMDHNTYGVGCVRALTNEHMCQALRDRKVGARKEGSCVWMIMPARSEVHAMDVARTTLKDYPL